MNMEWINFGLSLTTLLAGGGWFITYKAHKKKAMGEATQEEANGWQSMQDVYEETIEDLKKTCEYIREDRNLLREENTKLRQENDNLREMYKKLEMEVNELRNIVARQGRKIEALVPFSCGDVSCNSRREVKFKLKNIDNNDVIVLEENTNHTNKKKLNKKIANEKGVIIKDEKQSIE